MTTQIQQIFRHPVKGLTAEARDRVELVADFGMAGDRAFALMFEDTGDPQPQTPWLSKKHFAVQNDWGELAALHCTYDSDRQTLTVRQPGGVELSERVTTAEGRDRLSQFFSDYLQQLRPSSAARHPEATPVRLVGTADGTTRYPDRDRGQISIVSQATLDDLAAKLGVAAIDARRFRPNFVVSGVAAWDEFDWVGRDLQLGDARVAVTARIGRCANIDVNPDTGQRDLDLLSQLSAQFGHAQTGVIARVLSGGTVSVGTAVAAAAAV